MNEITPSLVFLGFVFIGLCEGVYILLYLRFAKNDAKREGILRGLEVLAEVTGNIQRAKILMVVFLMFTWLFFDLWYLFIHKDVQ